jgi:hypothetical protein
VRSIPDTHAADLRASERTLSRRRPAVAERESGTPLFYVYRGGVRQRFTFFSPDGTPLRATLTLSLRE